MDDFKKHQISIAVVMAMLIVTLMACIGLGFKIHSGTHRQDVRQEANPTFNIDTPATDAELHDQRVRDFLNRNTHGVDDADELPGSADGDPSAASGDN